MTCYDHHSVIKKNIAAKLTLTLTLKFRAKFFIASYSSHDEDKKSEKKSWHATQSFSWKRMLKFH